MSYEAFWIPGLEADIDRDVALATGFRWLRQTEPRFSGRGIVVVYAKGMTQHVPLLAEAASKREFISPRSPSPHRGKPGPVLAIWPNARTLELAEIRSFGAALCVIGGWTYDISPWIRRTGAQCLVPGFAVQEAEHLPEELTKSLDMMIFWSGHNAFLGAGDKPQAIRMLREIARRQDPPSRRAIEDYLRESGKVERDGVERIGKWYDEIQEGKRHRDDRRRVI